MSAANGSEIIAGGATAGVLLPLIFREPFDYRIPEGMQVAPGDWVQVPFGRKSVWGVVWGMGRGNVDSAKIKPLERIAAHLPPMAGTMRAFIDWVSWYTLAPKGMVLKMTVPVVEALEPPRQEIRYVLDGKVAGRRLQVADTDLRLTPSRLRIVSYLSDDASRTAKDIALHAKVSSTVINEFLKAGGLKAVPSLPPFSPPATGILQPATCSLSPDQAEATVQIAAKLESGFSVTLLDGVTGSGKTEVYFDAIARVLAKGRQALVLLPEIALSIQWLARFEKRFGFTPTLWHSGLGNAARRDNWRGIAQGDARVVVGARSALFLPFARLGLIVVDEEHDASYKQEEGVIYQARDMGVARSRHERIPTILVSATPSLETEFNIRHKALRARPFAQPFRRSRDARHSAGRYAAGETEPRDMGFRTACARACGNAGGWKTIALVHEPARLRTPHAVPCLRSPLPVPPVQRLSGVASRARTAGLSPLRL